VGAGGVDGIDGCGVGASCHTGSEVGSGSGIGGDKGCDAAGGVDGNVRLGACDGGIIGSGGWKVGCWSVDIDGCTVSGAGAYGFAGVVVGMTGLG
jgi:hypothetical protein